MSLMLLLLYVSLQNLGILSSVFPSSEQNNHGQLLEVARNSILMKTDDKAEGEQCLQNKSKSVNHNFNIVT